MEKKFVSIVFCMLLIATAVLPSVLTMNASTPSTTNSKELKVSANRLDFSQEEEMAITVENSGGEPVNFDVFPKVEIFNEQGEKIFPSYSEKGNWTLKPGEKETYVWDQKDLKGEIVNPGKFTIRTVSELAVEAVYIPHVVDIGYVILVAGDHSHAEHDVRCYLGPRQIYDDLVDIGFTDDRIQFLNREYNGVDPKIDDIASEETVEDAITVWAAARVGMWTPLYIIMFDHGGSNSFSVVNDVGGDSVIASDLRSWIDQLNDDTNARIDVWIMACHSGSFIDELSRNGKITITSTCSSLGTAGGQAPYYEYFTSYFWPKIMCGYTWGEAFNYACDQAHAAAANDIPLLDDDGDGVGHGLYDCSGVFEGDLPHDGDGSYAMDRYMGEIRLRCIFQVLHWNVVCPVKYYPPNLGVDTIPLWATIDTEEPLDNVSACLLDPNYVCVGCFDEVPCQYFKMTDEDNDGKWTVDIPIEEFYKYKATDFTILINAKSKNGQSTIPLRTNVFLRQASQDNKKPSINIDNPRDGQVVGGTLDIKGSVSDNIEVYKILIYLGNYKIKEITPSPCSHYYFNCSVNLKDFQQGLAQIQVIAYDINQNMNVLTRKITIVGSPSKPSTPSGPTSGKVGNEYPYKTATADPQGDKVFYLWDWGDGIQSGWLGPYDSGDSIVTSHKWGKRGIYNIKVKAKDIYGAESPWSDPLIVTMPKNKAITIPFLQFLQKFIQSHPNMFPILRNLLGI